MSDLFDEGEEQRRTPPPEPRRSRALIITAVVLVVGFFGLTTFSAFWTNRAWYDVVDYAGVFTTLLWTRVGLFAVFGALMGLVVGLNMYLAFRFRPLYRPPSPEQGSLDRYREVVVPIRLWLTIGVSALFGLAVPVAMIERTGFRASLTRARRIAAADFVHALGSLCALVIVFALTAAVLGLLLHGQADNAVRVAAFLAVLVLSPMLYIGAALLYYDQAARCDRLGSREPRPRSGDGDLHPPLDADAARRPDPQVEP